MRKSILVCIGLMVVIVCLLFSCRSTIKRSDYQNFVQSYAKYKPDIKGKKLCVLPFDCPVAFIGESISQNTAANLSGTGFELIDKFELSQRLKQTSIDLPELVKNKYYKEIISMADIDYLLVGDVQIYSPRRKKIISTTAYLLDANGNVVIKVRFQPPNYRWKMPLIGKILATEIKRESGAEIGDTIDLRD